MRQWMMTLAAGLGLALLTACGHAPETAPTGMTTVSMAPNAYKKPAAKTTAKATPKPAAPKTGTAAPQPTPQPTATSQPEASETATPAQEGSIKLAVNVSGNAPVASLVLKAFEQADAANAVSVPLTVSNGKATWNQADVPAGRYTFQVQALDADKEVLGSGTAEATVTAGQTSEVSLDLRVNLVEAESTPQGGTIGLTVEIL